MFMPENECKMQAKKNLVPTTTTTTKKSKKKLVQKLEGKNHGQKIEILIFMSSCYNGKQKQKKDKNERRTTKVKKSQMNEQK